VHATKCLRATSSQTWIWSTTRHLLFHGNHSPLQGCAHTGDARVSATRRGCVPRAKMSGPSDSAPPQPAWWSQLIPGRVNETLSYATDSLSAPWETTSRPDTQPVVPDSGRAAQTGGESAGPPSSFPPVLPPQTDSHAADASAADDDFSPATESKVTAPPGYRWPGGNMQVRVRPHQQQTAAAPSATEVLYHVSWRSTLSQGCVG